MDIKEFYSKIDHCYDTGDYQSLEDFLYATVRNYKPCCGKYNEIYVVAASELAAFSKARGKFDHAEYYYKEALSMLGKFHGTKSLNYATNLVNLASTYREMRDFTHAQRYYLEAKSIFEENGEEKHYLYSCILNNMGIMKLEQGKLDEGESLMLQSLELLKNMPGTEGERATSYLNLASHAYQLKDVEKAEKYMDYAMEYFADNQDDFHYLNARNLQAIMLMSRNKYEEAVSILEELKILIESKLKKNQNYYSTCRTLANAYEKIGDMEKAKKSIEEAMEGAERLFGQDSRFMKICQNDYTRISGENK